jgi:hypothetical protein
MPRPRLNPTDDQRNEVKSLSGYGLHQADIARMIGIRSPKTLRKHFRNELDRGMLEGTAKVYQTHYRMATGGKNLAATLSWLNRHDRRSGKGNAGAATPPTFIIVPDDESSK